MKYTCFKCGDTYSEITENQFFSDESQDFSKKTSRGVLYTTDAFNSDIYDDRTKNWECNFCWWTGWWEI